ncbi:SDR family oxidoreductase [Myxococcota bacterium]|nr:SDR family oxidoreductase [Myxococcota bacterium]
MTAAPILVFGGTGGIGSALVRRLAARRRPLHLAARGADRLRALAEALGCGYTVADALDEAAIGRAVEEACGGGALGGAAYAVGSIAVKSLESATARDFEEAFRLNALGAALLLRRAKDALTAGRGAVVLFSTVAASVGFPNHTVIASAKAAVEGLARAAAAELAPHVRINCVAPSLTATPLAAPLLASDAMASALARAHPLGRLGTPEDTAALADFLLSEDAGWITGEVVGVDGGRGSLRHKG